MIAFLKLLFSRLFAWISPIPIRDWLYAGAFVSLIWAGWYMRGVYDDHEKLAELELMQKQTRAILQKDHLLSQQLEAERVSASAENRDLHKQLAASRIVNHTADCALSPDELKGVNQ